MVRARGSRSSAPRAAPRAPAPAPAAHPQQHHQNMGAAPMGMRGPGMLGTMAAVAGGSILGHGISNMMFSRSEPPTQPQQLEQVAQAYEGTQCQPYIQTFEKCLQATGGNAEQCKYVWESFMECQEKLPKA